MTTDENAIMHGHTKHLWHNH